MDVVLSIVAIFLAWRFLLCLTAATALGLFLGYLLGPVVGFSLVLFGVGFGLIWQGRWLSGIPLFAAVPSTPISTPVAFLGLAFIGAIWGGFASEALGSVLGGALALVAAVALVGAWCTIVLKQHGQLKHLLFSGFSLLAGLGGLYALVALRA
jgi:hypothetical protein